jgi:MYXO-CTERM domain-containing protein
LAAVGVVASYAGQIQIGQTVSGVNYGLTTLWVTSPNTSGCTTGCASSTTTGYALRNYDKSLFEGAVPAPTPFTGFSGVTGTASTPGSTMFDSTNDITFNMVSQTGSFGNVWMAGSSNTLTIPMGVFGVQNVWTMLNNYFGNPGVNDTSVTFSFDNNADGSDAASLTTLTLDLRNGTEIRSAMDCTANCTTNFATSLATGPAGTVVSGDDIHCTGPNCIATVTVLANNLYSALNLTPNAASLYGGESVNGVLDDQGFLFGNAFANQYLVSIGITEKGYDISSSSASASALSAVTVQTFSTETPEPSTIMLGVGGLFALAFVRRRRTN